MNPSISILIPAYKRPEYTVKCLEALFKNTPPRDNVYFYLVDDGSQDGTEEVLLGYKARKNTVIKVNRYNMGLRDCLIDFIQGADTDFICKFDNDCLVPDGWLHNMFNVYLSTDVQILSPEVRPSFAGRKNGESLGGYLRVDSPYKIGGLWFMERSLWDGVYLEKTSNGGIDLAHHLIELVAIQKDLKAGWTDMVIVEDMGHWSGKHPDHIKSKDHLHYSEEVGRDISWA